MTQKSRCQRCGFSKESNRNEERCPKCRAFLRLDPIWINGSYFY